MIWFALIFNSSLESDAVQSNAIAIWFSKRSQDVTSILFKLRVESIRKLCLTNVWAMKLFMRAFYVECRAYTRFWHLCCMWTSPNGCISANLSVSGKYKRNRAKSIKYTLRVETKTLIHKRKNNKSRYMYTHIEVDNFHLHKYISLIRLSLVSWCLLCCVNAQRFHKYTLFLIQNNNVVIKSIFALVFAGVESNTRKKCTLDNRIKSKCWKKENLTSEKKTKSHTLHT